MTEIEFTQLLERFEKGLCSPDEKSRLEQWLDTMKEGRVPFESDFEKDQIKMALLTSIHSKTQMAKPKEADEEEPVAVSEEEEQWRPHWLRAKSLVWQLTVAASVLVFFSIGTYFYLNKDTPPPITANQPKVDIAPGGNKAILTLSDGSRIVLNEAQNGTLANQDNTSIRKAQDGQVVYSALKPGDEKIDLTAKPGYNTLVTPPGGQYRVTLSDGTQVWLNAASSLRYPTAFVGKERTVELTGEAYFEVAKNKKMPFRVKTARQEVEVLGTHFNVNAYADEGATKTTLLEGSVRIGQVVLKPGQACIDGKVTAAQVDQEVAWKNGFFNLNDKKLDGIMRELGRWYDIKVIYKNGVPDMKFWGKMGRNLPLSEVLKFLKENNIDFQLEGKTLTVLS